MVGRRVMLGQVVAVEASRVVELDLFEPLAVEAVERQVRDVLDVIEHAEVKARHDILLASLRPGRGQAVIDHRPAPFVAAFAQHAQRGDVGHHVVRVAGDPGAAAAEVGL